MFFDWRLSRSGNPPAEQTEQHMPPEQTQQHAQAVQEENMTSFMSCTSNVNEPMSPIGDTDTDADAQLGEGSSRVSGGYFGVQATSGIEGGGGSGADVSAPRLDVSAMSTSTAATTESILSPPPRREELISSAAVVDVIVCYRAVNVKKLQITFSLRATTPPL